MRTSPRRTAAAPARRWRLRIGILRMASAAAAEDQRQHESGNANTHQRIAGRLRAFVDRAGAGAQDEIDRAHVDAVGIAGADGEEVRTGRDPVDNAGLIAKYLVGQLR